MKKLIFILIALVLFCNIINAVYWVNDPNNCPTTHVDYPGFSCAPNDLCGNPDCYDTSTINAPLFNSTSVINVDGGSFSGGYLLDCFSDDSVAPLCDNNQNFWCDRSSLCYDLQFRETICLENTFGQSACGNCRTNYVNCSLDDDCEVYIGSTCASSATYDGNCNGLVGNCTCIGNYRDCDNNDGDGNILTAWSGNGCEILLGVTTNNSHSHYVTCNTFACDTNWLDLNGPGDGTDADGCEINVGGTCGSNAVYNLTGDCVCASNYYDCDSSGPDLGNGCEIQGGSSCNIGGAQGTYVGCTCVPGKSYFETGTLSSYLTSNPLFWGAQYGIGALLNLSNGSSSIVIDNETCIVFSDGTKQCNAGENSLWENDSDTTYVKSEYPQNINFTGNLSLGQKINFGFGEIIDNIVNNWIRINGNLNVTGDADFNGGWLNNGVSIVDGDLFAQTVYVYNLSSLNVNNLDVNGSLIPYFDNQFDIGNSIYKWRDASFSGNLNSQNGNFSNNVYVGGNVGIGTSNPEENLHIMDGIKQCNVFSRRCLCLWQIRLCYRSE
jgi:hypothetical protein